MLIRTRLAALALAALAITGAAAATASPAEAGHHGVGIGIGLATGALIGAAIASNAYAGPVYVDGYAYRRCGWVRRFDAYGNYIGRIRTCRY